MGGVFHAHEILPSLAPFIDMDSWPRFNDDVMKGWKPSTRDCCPFAPYPLLFFQSKSLEVGSVGEKAKQHHSLIMLNYSIGHKLCLYETVEDTNLTTHRSPSRRQPDITIHLITASDIP